MMTWTLCHGYARCTRSVSLPVPVFYAELNRERTARYLHEIVSKFWIFQFLNFLFRLEALTQDQWCQAVVMPDHCRQLKSSNSSASLTRSCQRWTTSEMFNDQIYTKNAFDWNLPKSLTIFTQCSPMTLRPYTNTGFIYPKLCLIYCQGKQLFASVV